MSVLRFKSERVKKPQKRFGPLLLTKSQKATLRSHCPRKHHGSVHPPDSGVGRTASPRFWFTPGFSQRLVFVRTLSVFALKESKHRKSARFLVNAVAFLIPTSPVCFSLQSRLRTQFQLRFPTRRTPNASLPRQVSLPLVSLLCDAL